MTPRDSYTFAFNLVKSKYKRGTPWVFLEKVLTKKIEKYQGRYIFLLHPNTVALLLYPSYDNRAGTYPWTAISPPIYFAIRSFVSLPVQFVIIL